MSKISKKHVLAICPICNQNFGFEVDRDLVNVYEGRFPIPLLIAHNTSTLVAYIDAHLKCRGIESVYHIVDLKYIKSKEKEKSEITGNPIDSKFIEKLTPEEKIILSCDIACEQIMKEQIHNVLDRQILRIIAQNKEISLAILLSELIVFESALNRKIDLKSVLKIVERYLKRKIIKKQVLKDSYDINDRP